MKTEQEQIEKMAQVLCDDCGDNTVLGKLCKSSKGSYICECEKRKATALVQAGYGDVSEYKAEIERLRTTLGQCSTELNSALESLKSQCREIGELKAKIKQAQIDVLNNVKDVLANQKHECLERNNLVGYSAICVCEKFIDGLIKEVQNGKDKG